MGDERVAALASDDDPTPLPVRFGRAGGGGGVSRLARRQIARRPQLGELHERRDLTCRCTHSVREAKVRRQRDAQLDRIKRRNRDGFECQRKAQPRGGHPENLDAVGDPHAGGQYRRVGKGAVVPPPT